MSRNTVSPIPEAWIGSWIIVASFALVLAPVALLEVVKQFTAQGSPDSSVNDVKIYNGSKS